MTAINSKIAALQIKLATAVALVASLEAQIKAADQPLPVKGDTVSFTFGRGDKKVEHTGRVIATNDGDNGVTYVSVLVNEDTLPEIKRVPAKDVTVAETGKVEGNTCTPSAAITTDNLVVGFDNAAPVLDEHAAAVAELLGE